MASRARFRFGIIILLLLAGSIAGSYLLSVPQLPVAGGAYFAAGEEVYGSSLGEWNARQWRWTLSQPIGSNPGQDVTGARCGEGQTAPVYFLPRNFAPCRVPADVLIFVPIVGTECSTIEAPPYFGKDEASLRSCASDEIDRYTNIIVRIDGTAIPDVTAYRAQTPLFNVTLPEHNILGVASGGAHFVADGYQLLLAPLESGEHEIMVHVELIDGTILPDKVIQLTVTNS